MRVVCAECMKYQYFVTNLLMSVFRSNVLDANMKFLLMLMTGLSIEEPKMKKAVKRWGYCYCHKMIGSQIPLELTADW